MRKELERFSTDVDEKILKPCFLVAIMTGGFGGDDDDDDDDDADDDAWNGHDYHNDQSDHNDQFWWSGCNNMQLETGRSRKGLELVKARCSWSCFFASKIYLGGILAATVWRQLLQNSANNAQFLMVVFLDFSTLDMHGHTWTCCEFWYLALVITCHYSRKHRENGGICGCFFLTGTTPCGPECVWVRAKELSFRKAGKAVCQWF